MNKQSTSTMLAAMNPQFCAVPKHYVENGTFQDPCAEVLKVSTPESGLTWKQDLPRGNQTGSEVIRMAPNPKQMVLSHSGTSGHTNSARS